MARTRTDQLGPAARPVAVPHDVGDPTLPKAAGIVRLPLRVRWSDPVRMYDLDRRADRLRVYEQVLREGTEADVRYFIRLDVLVDLWHELVLPPHVRRAWESWSALHGADLAC